jgi:transposase
MDNASIHHVDSVVDTILSVGALVGFLPPYSPDMNPIEEVFGEVKYYLQANNTRFQATSSPRAMILQHLI